MTKREMVIYECKGRQQLINIYELSRLVELHPALIEKLYWLGVIDPQVEEPELLFEDRVIARIDKIMRLKKDLGVNYAGCAIILDLLDKIKIMERKLLQYEKEFWK